MQSIDSIETHACEISKYLVNRKEEIKCNNIIKNKKMTNFNDITSEKINEYNLYWPQVSNYRYRVLINGGSGPGKPT